MRQFSIFAWTHTALLIIVSQSYLIMQNTFAGMIWLLGPVSMIICCDVMSYMFGFFFGRTPLIKLSPKKTWEGFIGGAVSTIVFGLLLSYVLMQYPYFTCPLEDYEAEWPNCPTEELPSTFKLTNYTVSRQVAWLFRLFGRRPLVQLYPFLFHTFILALFASILGPFGGFFASGFKRAFKIKDFADTIPGHGGLMDRFDCQLLMGTFTWVYIHTFISPPNSTKLVQQIQFLKPEEQCEVYRMLVTELASAGLLSQRALPVQCGEQIVN